MIAPSATGQLEYFKEIKSKALKINNLYFIDFVPFNKINRYFNKAKIFVNTSIEEGFPTTFIQAAKSKIPILSLSLNPDNIFNKYKIGFCCGGYFEKLKSNLDELLMDNKLHSQMSENAYVYAREYHDIKINASKFLNLIIDLF